MMVASATWEAGSCGLRAASGPLATRGERAFGSALRGFAAKQRARLRPRPTDDELEARRSQLDARLVQMQIDRQVTIGHTEHADLFAELARRGRLRCLEPRA